MKCEPEGKKKKEKAAALFANREIFLLYAKLSFKNKKKKKMVRKKKSKIEFSHNSEVR